MPVNLIQYRGEIGVFYYNRYCKLSCFQISITRSTLKFLECCLSSLIDFLLLSFLSIVLNLSNVTAYRHHSLKVLLNGSFICSIRNFIFHLWLCRQSILLSGDVEVQPGPTSNGCETLSVSHWNLNSICSHDFSKISQFIAFNAEHKFDIVCFSETFLNSDTLPNDNNLVIPGYTLVRCDHPTDSKRGGVCVYFKSILPIKVLDINFFSESVNFELEIDEKMCSFLALYRSPSQTPDQFDEFMKNFEINLDYVANKNPFLIVVIGDFNAKSENWFKSSKTTHEGKAIESLTMQYGLSQLINEATFVSNNTFSCIDLIFTSQTSLVVDSGVCSSLNVNCHHQIIFAKFNLKIHYPPPYMRKIWHYRQANVELIQRAIENCNWENLLTGDDVDMYVSKFNEIVLNIMSNYIPCEYIVCDDKDPPWITKHIKKLVHESNLIFKRFSLSKNNLFLQRQFKNSQDKLMLEIEKSKENYFKNISNKLSKSSSNSKHYWSLLKTFLIGKKIPCIPPIFHIDKHIVDFQKKCDLFNSFFAQQCSLIDTNSTLPMDCEKVTNASLHDITFTSDDILNIVRNLDPNKAHGHDDISIRMLRICDKSICRPLAIIFNCCIRTKKYPSEWKKANVIPIHKKGDKQILKNYRPISLLPICDI